jgi:hypothetical protein
MMLGWHKKQCLPIATAMSICGPGWAAMFHQGKGLPPAQHGAFARDCGMKSEPLMCVPAAAWLSMLRKHGPLAVVTANPFHARILIGIFGDGTATRTTVTVIDPASGTRYNQSFAVFTRDFEAVASSPRAQIWHY